MNMQMKDLFFIALSPSSVTTPVRPSNATRTTLMKRLSFSLLTTRRLRLCTSGNVSKLHLLSAIVDITLSTIGDPEIDPTFVNKYENTKQLFSPSYLVLYISCTRWHRSPKRHAPLLKFLHTSSTGVRNSGVTWPTWTRLQCIP